MAGGGQRVVTPERPLLVPGDRRFFPSSRGESFPLEPAQDWINGAARQLRDFHDVEAVGETVGKRVEHQRRGGGYLHAAKSTYVELQGQVAQA